MVRTRIAPSPTGFPHIGTIYQILFDWAWARKNDGKFVVRIEDTDRNRFVEGAEDVIFQAIDWFGLTEDESPRKGGDFGPYRQSERLAMYQKYAGQLVLEGKAYYCNCTTARLAQVRDEMQKAGKSPMYDKHCRNLNLKKEDLEEGSFVVRLKIPEEKVITILDGIRGEITFDSNTVDDQVILKSDGFPTYHLGVVVDDHLMKITDVVRGEEWLTSTPKHFILYDYFGWEKPHFYHTPVLRNPDKSKLSKRHGHTNVSWYREEGYLPEAILNFLALMGWSHPEEKEIFSLDEFVSLFDLKDIKAVGPIFDLQKLTWMNGIYIRESENSKLKSQILELDPTLRELDDSTLECFIEIAKSRMKTLKEFKDLIMPFIGPQEIDLTDEQKKVKEKLSKSLELIENWNVETLVGILKEFANTHNLKFKDYYKILLGQTAGLPLADAFVILGKEKTLDLISL